MAAVKCFKRFGITLGVFLAGFQAVARDLPPAAGKPWQGRFEELSLASGKCKAAVEEASAALTKLAEFLNAPEAEQAEGAGVNVPAPVADFVSTYLRDPKQDCSKRALISYVIGIATIHLPEELAEELIQTVVGGILQGNVKLLSLNVEKNTIIQGLGAGFGRQGRLVWDTAKLPELATFLDIKGDGTLYINPRMNPKTFLPALVGGLNEQAAYFEFLHNQSLPRADKRLASTKP